MEEVTASSMKKRVIDAFNEEFAPIAGKFEILDLLYNNSPMEYKAIERLKLPSAENNIVWHPGVYVFIGDNKVYRVGVSMINSRKRVLEHIKVQTRKGGYCIGDIVHFDDKSILLFNIKKPRKTNDIEDGGDRHWLLALKVYLEQKFKPLIKAGRIG